MKKDIIFTAEPAEMSGKYVAEDLYRKWTEVEEKTDKLKAGFVLTLNEAKKVNCTDIVPKELSNEFYPDDAK